MDLIVKNFGPIKDAHIQTKRYNVLIGNTSTGKSVLAKLISIAYELEFYFIEDGNFDAFAKLLKKYCIDFPFSESTQIEISFESAHWIITKDCFRVVKSFGDEDVQRKADIIANVYDKNASIYIPAERNLMSVFTNNIFSFLKSGSNIPESIKRFGSLYEAAKGENKNLSIDFMNIKVDFANENDKIVLDDAGTEIRFEQASSGMQSIIPLWAVFLYGIKNHSLGTAIIEEPEQNLFPTLQVDLVNNLVAQLNQTKANLLITTHSPYILSVLDNLIYANDVYQKAKAADKKEQIQRIEKLVNPSMLINYDEVAAYLCKDDGVVERMNDDEMRNTGAYALDKASTITSHIFNELMDIENEL
jgi:predicted ATP-dependent endonuclease of OLD family